MIKKTSWLFVLLTPSRWLEAIQYFLAPAVCPHRGSSDRPDPRDVEAKIKGAPRVDMPEEFYLDDKAEALGWVSKKQSKNACSAYSKGNGVEITNTVLNQKPCYIDKEVQWGHQEDTGGSREEGDFIQNAEKQFHDDPQGFPQTGYGRLRRGDNSIHGVKRWLLNNETVRTLVYWKYIPEKRMTNFELLKQSGEYIPGSGTILSGHAILYTGWDDNYECLDGSRGAFRFKESEEMQMGDNAPGKFWISYTNFDKYRSKYVSMDEWDVVH